MKHFLTHAVALIAVLAFTSISTAQITLINEDFTTGPGAVTGGNGAAGFAAAGGVGTLTGNGSDTFFSIGVTGLSIPEFALGGQLSFQVEQLGLVANPISRFLQVNIDGANVFLGNEFGGTNDTVLLDHGDGTVNTGTATIPAGTNSLDLLYVTHVDFGTTSVPNAEIARLGSFTAVFTPNAIPEPASTTLLALGATCFLGMRRRNR